MARTAQLDTVLDNWGLDLLGRMPSLYSRTRTQQLEYVVSLGLHPFTITVKADPD